MTDLYSEILDYKNITVFTQRYDKATQAEGLAVNECVISGACDKCLYLSICETNTLFMPPSGSACMVRKAEILSQWDTEG